MYCKNCGHQISDNANFCKNCGANFVPSTKQPETTQVEQPTPQSHVPPPPAYTNSVNVSKESIPPSFKKSKDKSKKWLLVAGVVVIGIIIGVLTNTGSNEKKFSALSEQEQETLMTKLYERLDQYFISDLQIDEQLAQLLVYEDETMSYFFDNINQEALEKEGQEIGLKVGRELMEVAEKWASDSNIDFEDWVNNIDDEALLVNYMTHLIQIATEQAEATMQEMKETLREGLRQGAFDDNDWIVGNWAPDTGKDYAEGEVITFDSDGNFDFGDDCRTKGTYTIQEYTVHLNGKTECPDCSDCEVNEYSNYLKINSNSLEGYKKLP